MSAWRSPEGGNAAVNIDQTKGSWICKKEEEEEDSFVCFWPCPSRRTGHRNEVLKRIVFIYDDSPAVHLHVDD